MDGQANLTESFGLSIEEEQTVYGAMRGEYPLPVIKAENGISIVPACLDLSAAESELINEPGRELILKGLIARLLETCKFDYILIDCPLIGTAYAERPYCGRLPHYPCSGTVPCHAWNG